MKQRIIAGAGIAAMMALLAGCDEIKFGGSLSVLEQMTFTQPRGPVSTDQKVEWDLSKTGGNVVLNPGQYPTKITMGKSGKKKELTLEVANASPATVIKMKFDKNIELGENFTLTAAQLGQNFDLTGNLLTKVEKSPEQSGRESCTYQYPETVCRPYKSADTAIQKALTDAATLVQGSDVALAPVPQASNPQFSKYPGQYPGYNTPNCSTVWVSRPGSMFVRYYEETTLRDISAKFVQGDKTLAGYKGLASNTERVYTYQGPCGY